jgi:uncharacterized protein with HEPN domain
MRRTPASNKRGTILLLTPIRRDREAHAEIPWRQITGICHRIVHKYMGFDYDIVWEVATRHISPLMKNPEAIMPPADR